MFNKISKRRQKSVLNGKQMKIQRVEFIEGSSNGVKGEIY